MAGDAKHPTFRVKPGGRFRLADVDPADHPGHGTKAGADARLAALVERLRELQERLWAEHTRALLVVFQAIDAGGKDGCIEKVFTGVNPAGIQVSSFKAPSAEELAHDYLWRIHAHTPARGTIGVFNRSHYEDVLVVRVKGFVSKKTWRARYEQINDWERMLHETGTAIVKFFLHISRAEQAERFRARLADPSKQWKFAKADLAERERWDEYQAAFEDALRHCSTSYAPWHCVPSNAKWYRNLVVAQTLVDTLEAMDPRYPEPEPGLDQIVIPD
jgi:PPK2 family polyphosphate:nucleotide phosphotransferase